MSALPVDGSANPADQRAIGPTREKFRSIGERIAEFCPVLPQTTEEFSADPVGSALAREVRAELMRALVRSGQKFQAQLEARRYLKAYPSGPARAEAQSLLDLPDDKASPTTDVSP